MITDEAIIYTKERLDTEGIDLAIVLGSGFPDRIDFRARC